MASLAGADTSLYFVLLRGSASCALLYVLECLILLQIIEPSSSSRSDIVTARNIFCLLAPSRTQYWQFFESLRIGGGSSSISQDKLMSQQYEGKADTRHTCHVTSIFRRCMLKVDQTTHPPSLQDCAIWGFFVLAGTGSDTSLYIDLAWVASLTGADTSLYFVLRRGSASCALLYVLECLILLQITELSHSSLSDIVTDKNLLLARTSTYNIRLFFESLRIEGGSSIYICIGGSPPYVYYLVQF